MSERILFVDDDTNLLAGCRRSLRGLFQVETAEGGEQGLDVVAKGEPFAVILADMRMPNMDGAQFLSSIKTLAPDSVRMMLTGNADQETAIRAVNEGRIFRFLNKPCPKETLIRSIEAAVKQYRLVIAERQVLEETLNGCIEVMADILSMIRPAAFGRASRARRYARHVAEALSLPNAWQIEIAAMLSQIGCVSLPDETLEKIYAAQELTKQEQESFTSHPRVGGRLIVNIPRLDKVAGMIEAQQNSPPPGRADEAPQDLDEVAVGGHILKVALDFDRLLAGDIPPKTAIDQLRRQEDLYDTRIVDALADMEISPPQSQLRTVKVDGLKLNMIFDQDVHAANGALLITKGQEVTITVREHLRQRAQTTGVQEPIRVIVQKYC